MVASTRTTSKAMVAEPAEVEEDLTPAHVNLSRSPSEPRRMSNEALVASRGRSPFAEPVVSRSRSPSEVRRTNHEASVEVAARKPIGARRPSYEALHAAASQWPSMSIHDRGSRYTPPETRDAAAKLAQATWDAAHKAATVGPAILAPVSQRRRVSLREAMRVMPAEELMTPDSPSRPPTLLSIGDSSPNISHRPRSARAEADWQANTVMHVRRARVVCQEAQSRLMRIGSQDGPVFSRLYDDHLNRMDRFERHKAKVQPLSSKLRYD